MSPDRMRIDFVTNDLGVGGAQRFLISLLGALDRDRFRPRLATVCGQGPLVAAVRELGVDSFHVEAVRRVGRLRVVDPLAVARLARWMRDGRTELVHSQLFLGNTLGRIAAVAAGVPRRFATEHSTYFDHTPLHWWLDRRLARRSERIVAISEPVARYIIARGAPRDRVHVVANGIALERFEKLPSREQARRGLGIAGNAFVLGSAARLTAEKSFERVVELLPGLLTENPRILLLLMGDGPERPRLARRARELGVSGAIRLLGERHDVAELLPALDLFVLPSRREGLPTAVLEAMAAGVPPVVQDLPYARALFEDGAAGRRIDFGDRAAASAALLALARDPGARLGLAAGARRTAAGFSIRHTAQALAALYHPGEGS